MNQTYFLKSISLLTLILFFISILSVKADTNFGAFQDNNFLNANNWTNGLPSSANPGTVVAGTTAIISAAHTINYVLTSYGNIQANANVTITSAGMLNNFTGAVFTINASRTLTNNGKIDQHGTTVINENGTFINGATGTYVSAGSALITNNGTLSISGNFSNFGTVTNNATLTILGGVIGNNTAINNNSTLNFNGGTLTNTNGANITNASLANFNHGTSGLLNNLGTLTNNGTYNNNGDISSNGTIANNSLFNNNNGGDIANNFKLNNAGTFNNNNLGNIVNGFEINNSGIFNNNFFIDNGNAINNLAGGNFKNAAVGKINNKFGSTITNSNIFSNLGEIISVGVIINKATFSNDGSISTNTGGGIVNQGNFTNKNLLNNLETITNTGTFTNQGQLQNNSGGVFTNNGELYNHQPARISNQFDLINNKNLYNFGTIENGVRLFNNDFFENNGYLINIGDFENGLLGVFQNTSTGVLENTNGGVFTNLGTINNNKEIFNLACSSFINKGIINNFQWFNNKGLFFNLGTFNKLPYEVMDMEGGVEVTGPTSSLICESITASLDAQGKALITGAAISTEAFDDCSTLTLKVNDQTSVSYTCADLGVKTVKLTITDRKGNSVTCQTAITVVDDMAPVFQNCPANVIVVTNTTSSPATWTPPTATDNCGPVTITTTHQPGSTFQLGTTQVSYSAKDGKNNISAPCTFTVTIVPQGDCAQITAIRQVTDTNDNCGSWCGGAYTFTFGPGNCYTAGPDLLFIEYSDKTAQLTGSIYKGGARAYLDIQLSGRTTTAPSGSPKYELCVKSGASGWAYYPTFSGKFIHENGSVTNIVRFGPSFQLGMGGNLQDPTKLGASGWFSTNGGSAHGGDFNFRLSDPRPCQNSIYLEAECANSIGSNWTRTTDPAASNGEYLMPPNNNSYDYPPLNTADLLTFNVNVAGTGYYRLFARVKTKDGSSDSFWVRVNNGNWVKWNSINPGTTNYEWDQAGDWRADAATPVTFNLNAGANTIQFSWRESNTRLDKLFLTYNGKKPTGLGATAANCGGGGGPTPPACNKTALFVVGNTTLNAGDAAVKARLENNGFNIMVKDAVLAVTSDATGKGIVIISSTVNSGDVNTKFRDVTIPVVTWEAWLYDDMKMTGTTENTHYGSHNNETRVQISNSTHPIAAGLSGTVTVNNSQKEMSFGTPGSSADVIAHVPGDPKWTLIFAYETGKTMAGMNAPARRVGFFARDESGSCFTQEGWKLFDASITWALNCGTPPPPPVTCNKTALLVTESSNLNSSDNAIKERLKGLGYTVTIMDDDACKTTDANGKGLIVISSTVNSDKVKDKYRDVTVPVIVWEGWLFDDMKMTGTTADTHYGNASKIDKITIQDGTHPIVQGVTGNLAIFNSGNTVTWGLPGTGATRIGHVPNFPNCVMLFTYDTGASMVGMNAPARRVGFFLHNNTATDFRSTGWQIFDRTVQWASGCNLGVAAGASNEVLSLKAMKEDRHINLYWTNNTGFKNQFFILEKSVDGVNFEVVNEMNAYLEEDNSTNLFQDIDFQPETGENWYRVTVMYLDGSTQQSEVRMVEMNDIARFALYPNPASNYTDINLEDIVGEREVAIRLHDSGGRQMEEIRLDEVAEPFFRLDLFAFETGQYTVSIIRKNKRPVYKNLIIIK